ncbi:hypothetical protein [Fructilactobacillus carniphilus]|uniref:Fungal lipase-like domain-containing protein n=1 Tax=Fructilactobacillus carniphilus TaxID=2940297 RepID=A0ABY5BW47_9LACO|nr:hypothetical protein [Fructilactobacillus carniphilus]USS90567.1 hypothetical protein M3M37_06965 [Fructilactobacillus carniphilus]
MNVPLTDQQNNELSNWSYRVDASKFGKKSIRSGRVFIDKTKQQYKVINALDDKKTGFQGMAVAPYVNGKPDYHNIQIAIAGTNAMDVKDDFTDATQIPEAQNAIDTFIWKTSMFTSKKGILEFMVVNSMKRQLKHPVRNYGAGATKSGKSQFSVANRFYNNTVSKLKQKGFSANDIKHGTGHSLGGALIFYLAAKHHFPMTAFSSADPTSNLSSKDLDYIKKHPDMFKDYYHSSDVISNWQDSTHLGKYFSVSEF